MVPTFYSHLNVKEDSSIMALPCLYSCRQCQVMQVEYSMTRYILVRNITNSLCIAIRGASCKGSVFLGFLLSMKLNAPTVLPQTILNFQYAGTSLLCFYSSDKSSKRFVSDIRRNTKVSNIAFAEYVAGQLKRSHRYFQSKLIISEQPYFQQVSRFLTSIWFQRG